jgi:hypothetical protein
MTVRREDRTSGIFEKAALVVALCICAPFGILAFQLMFGMTPLFKSTMPFKGPVLIAIYLFTCVLAVATLGDAKLVPYGGLSGTRRIARHLWRRCLGLTLAARFVLHQRVATAASLPCAHAAALFRPAVAAIGVFGFLDDPRSLHELAARKLYDINSRYAL